jgi:hypothetical protein
MISAPRVIAMREQGACMFKFIHRATTIAAVASTAVGLTSFLSGPVRAASPTGAALAQAQVVPPKKKSTEAVDESALTRCMDTWDRQTQMTKEEYRESCKRSIQENPELFTKPF